MKNSKFTEVQIIKILSEQNQGKSVNEICRDHGMSQATFFKWKSKYGGMDVQQLSKMKEMEKELSLYKKIVAEQTKETIACKSERTLTQTNLPKCNLEHGFYARQFGKRKKREKFEYY